MGASDVRAGGAYVEVYTKDITDEGLTRANQKVRSALAVTQSLVTSAGTTVATGAGTAYAAVTLIGRGIANAVNATGGALSATASKVSTLLRGPQTGLTLTAAAVERLTPLSTKLWDVTQGGLGRATRMLGTLRSLLAAAGPAAQPMLTAFDNLAKKGAGIAWGARAGALLRGDLAGATAADHGLKAGRELYLQDRMRGFGSNIFGRGFGGLIKAGAGEGGGWAGIGRDLMGSARGFGAAGGQALSWLNIRGGYAATAVLNKGLSLTGSLLKQIGNASGMTRLAGGTASLAKSMISLPFRAVTSGFGLWNRQSNEAVSSTNRVVAVLGRLRSAASATFGALRTGSTRLAGISAGILGPLTAAAAMHVGGLTQLFTSKGFAQHGTDIFDAAKKHGISAEKYSALAGASQLSGISMDDAKSDPKKMQELLSHVGRASSLGAVVTTDQAKMAKEGTVAMSELGIATRSIGTAIGTAVLPQITAGVRWTTQLAVAIAGWIQKNPQLISQVFTIGKVVGVAAAVIGGLAGAATLLANPITWAAIAAGTLTAAMPTLLSAGQETFGGLSEAVAILQQDFDTTFGGMTDALAAGDLSLAAEVLWAGVRLVFNRGWQFIDSGWLTAKNATLDILDELWTGLRVQLDEWSPGFEKDLSGTLVFVQNIWTATVNGMMAAWDTGFAQLKKSLNYLRSLFDKTFNLKGANDAIDQKLIERVGARGTEAALLIAKRKAELAERNKAIDQKGAATVLFGEKDQRAQERKEQAEKQRKADADAVTEAQEQLNLVRNRARKEREAKEKALSATVAQGADLAKKGATDASRRGVEAQDIRTQGGLSVLAQASRGGQSLQQQMKSLAEKQVKEAQDANTWNQKNWQQLVSLNTNLPLQATPIDGGT